MTTMDSDSESQDSDEGRRFRFEATRKDPMTPFQSYRRDISPLNNASRHCRTRSRDRTIHTRRENRNIPISTKERTNERNNYEEPRSSKEKKNLSSDSGRKKEAGSKNRDLKKTYKTSRDVQERNSSCRDDQILQSRDEKRKRSRDRNWEYKSSGKYRKYSREREQLSQRAKSFQRQKPSGEKIGNHDKDKLNQLEHRNIEDKPDRQDCKDLNLSDFDIVSDAEGNSDNSDEIIESGNENIERRDCNAAENDKVKLRNCDKSSGSYLSNPDGFSDFLLASTSIKTISADNSDTLISKHEKTRFTNSDRKEEPEMAVNKHVDIDEEMYGPALPPNVRTKSYDRLKIIGPNLPNYSKKATTQDENDEEANRFGPPLPEHLRKSEKATDGPVLLDAIEAKRVGDDEEDGTIGPLPADHPTLKYDLVQKQLEYRAQLINRELAEFGDIEERKREEWMTELPRVDAVNLGLGTRKFRMRAGPDLSDRSDWTDTPTDRAKKKGQYAMGKTTGHNGEPQKILPDEPISRKGKSLFEMHQKNMHAKKNRTKKEAKECGKLPERRPFDRDIDLQVNRFDEARTSSILMKAAALDDRFSCGTL